MKTAINLFFHLGNITVCIFALRMLNREGAVAEFGKSLMIAVAILVAMIGIGIAANVLARG